MILVGEMRDFETIETALTAAETGHLVMSTLHTLDATETINRIISVFPPYQQKQVRLQLASILKAVISQRLVPRADGKGRVPALEVLVSTARVRECIGDKDRTKEIHDAISKGFTTYGMQTFDQSLMQLVKKASSPTKRRSSTSRTPTTSRCASAASPRPRTELGATSRATKDEARGREARSPTADDDVAGSTTTSSSASEAPASRRPIQPPGRLARGTRSAIFRWNPARVH